MMNAKNNLPVMAVKKKTNDGKMDLNSSCEEQKLRVSDCAERACAQDDFTAATLAAACGATGKRLGCMLIASMQVINSMQIRGNHCGLCVSAIRISA